MTENQVVTAQMEWDKLIERLNKAGIPHDPHWRTLVLYMRNMGTYTFLSEKQKAQLQHLIVDTLKSKDYSQDRYMNIVQQQEEILLGPHKEKMQMALDETKALLDDVRDLLLRKKGDVQDLEATTVDLVEKGTDPKDLISSMRKAFHEVVNNMEQDMEDLTRLSMTDQLTQLNNRRAFDEILQECVKGSLEEGWPLSLVMIDIDHFKHFNDTYGHRIGDQALQVVSKTLSTLGNQVNAEAGDSYHACRYGGEEFTVVLPYTNARSAAQVAEEIRQRVERCSFNIQNKNGVLIHQGLKITISLGVQEMKREWNGAYVTNLVECADRKLYHAKESGRNRVCFTLDG